MISELINKDARKKPGGHGRCDTSLSQDTHTQHDLFRDSPKQVFWDYGGKPEYPERTRTNTGRTLKAQGARDRTHSPGAAELQR